LEIVIVLAPLRKHEPNHSYTEDRTLSKATLKFLRKIMKRHGRPHIFVTDKLRSYGAAMKEIGNVVRQESGRWLNNRAENSHPPFGRRERAMLRFRQMRTLQKFVAVHASVHNLLISGSN
jgi:putative transposase